MEDKLSATKADFTRAIGSLARKEDLTQLSAYYFSAPDAGTREAIKDAWLKGIEKCAKSGNLLQLSRMMAVFRIPPDVRSATAGALLKASKVASKKGMPYSMVTMGGDFTCEISCGGANESYSLSNPLRPDRSEESGVIESYLSQRSDNSLSFIAKKAPEPPKPEKPKANRRRKAET